jgi:DNA polymerase III subunit delta
VKITPDTLAQHLAGQLLPAYLVSGDEPLLSGEAADEIRARARAAGFTEREVHFIERAGDWDDVRASGANLSLFGARRVVEIRMHSGKPGVAGGAALVALLKAKDPDTLYLILAPRLDRDAQGAEWVRTVDAVGAWVQVWPVEAQRLVAWLKVRCRKLALEADADALELLAARTEGNLLAAHQELTKLTLLAEGKRITAEAVLASVADSARYDVFQLGESVLAGATARALRMLAGLKAEGTEPTLVLWALAKSLRDLSNLASGAGGRPQPWQRPGAAAALAHAQRRAPRLAVRDLARRASRADRMIKGRLPGDAWDELALLAGDLCAQPAMPQLTVVG